MRIIAGKYKGHKLVSFKAKHIRPTLDSVKESVFNKWMAYWDGARVLDLFSGTGSLSFEALSRGAVSVTCVESHYQSIEIIKKNQEKLKITSGLKVIKQDVFGFLKSFKGEAFDIILVDPPFTESLADSVMDELSRSSVWKEGTLLMIESSGKEKILDNYGKLTLSQRKKGSDKVVNFYQV